MKKITSVFLALVMIISSVPFVLAANPVPATSEWLSDREDRSSVSGKIWQNPGENENDRVFTRLSDNTDNSFTYSDGRNKFTVTPDTKITVYGVVNTVVNSDEEGGIPQMGLIELIIRWIKSILARIPVPYSTNE